MLKQTIASKNSLFETIKLILLSAVNQLLEEQRLRYFLINIIFIILPC